MPPYARAHVMRDAVVTIEGVTYSNQVTAARLVPETNTQSMRTLVPDGTIVDTDSAVWTFELSGVQDFGANSLGAALRTFEGQEIDVVLQPRAGAGNDVATFTAVAVAIPFGGESGEFRTFEATLPVRGKPVWSQSA